MVIAYASRSLRLSQRRYCTTRREMLAAVVNGDVHVFPVISAGGSGYPSYGSQWLQKFLNEDGIGSLVLVAGPIFGLF